MKTAQLYLILEYFSIPCRVGSLQYGTLWSSFQVLIPVYNPLLLNVGLLTHFFVADCFLSWWRICLFREIQVHNPLSTILKSSKLWKPKVVNWGQMWPEITWSDQIRSVAQSWLTLCDPMNRSMPGLPVQHQLREFTETHVHRVSDAIQPSHPLSSPSPPAPNPSQHQSLFFQWVNSSHEVA